MGITTFSGKGIIQEIGKIIEFGKAKYLELKIEMTSGQVLNFYIIEYESTPSGFQEIRKNFGEHNPYKIGDKIQFQFSLKEKNGKYKLRIDSTFNKGFKK